MKQKQAKTTGKRTTLIVLCVVLGLILAVLLGATFYVEYLMGRMNYVDSDIVETLSASEIEALENETEPEDADFTGPVVDENDVSWGDGPNTAIGGEEIVNILLIGQDTRTSTRARSDSMILLTFNTDKNTITMTSFMRDMYVQIPGYKDNRINAAYSYGGMKLLNETLYTNFGVEVDGNVEVDFTQFTKIIDLLGGIDMELTGSEAWYINEWVENSYLREGTNHLNGEQALTYARTRNIDVDGDFTRTSRQRKLLNQLVQEFKNAEITTMLSLLNEILPMVTTDMTKSEITGYVKDLFPMLASASITTQRIPVDGGYYSASIRGMSVLVPDLEMNTQALVDSLTGFGGGVG